jgi:histidinol-phosphate aminotransferase
MPGYEPVEPPEVLARRLGLPVEAIAKLDANENPYGPSPLVREALAGYKSFHLYPDPAHSEVREALAKYVGVGAEYIVAGSGADELLDIVTRMTLAPGDAAVDNVPTFGMYPFIVQLAGGRVAKVQRRDDFSLDIDGVRAEVAAGAKLVFVASPNNPTGNVATTEEVEALLALDALIVIDEAYAEFAGKSYVKLVLQKDNLIVLRTFSKWAGLAGLRAGYGVMPQRLAELAMRVKMPYNLNAAAQVAMLASLEDVSGLMANVDKIARERERLREKLATVPFLTVQPSSANFLLCEVSGMTAKDVWQKLRQQGIIVRYYNTPLLNNYVRISVGRPQDTDRVVAALQEIGEAVHGRA